MRTTILALSALAFSLPLADNADACGSYQVGPTLMMTKTQRDDTRDTGRTFVDLGPAGDQAAGARWRQLDRRSFDDTAIAPLKLSDRARTITVVGRTGTRVVTSRAQWLLRRPFGRGEVRLVLEVEAPGIEPQVAIAGDHADARWQQPVHVEPDAEHARWMGARVELASQKHVSSAKLDDLEVLTAYGKTGSVTIVRRAGVELLREKDTIRGALTMKGRRMLVVQRGDVLDTVEL